MLLLWSVHALPIPASHSCFFKNYVKLQVHLPKVYSCNVAITSKIEQLVPPLSHSQLKVKTMHFDAYFTLNTWGLELCNITQLPTWWFTSMD